jgi:HK97 gp10 family phage protein
MRADIFGFRASAKQLEKRLEGWRASVRSKAAKAMKQVALRWHAEAVERVPVDEGTLRNRILQNSYEENGVFIAEVGSNLEYAKFLEFGTDYIAGGKVKALGDDPGVTDAQAITVWAAKNADLVSNKTGKADKRANAAIDKNLKAGGSQEQMPWLRPAFNSIRRWAEKLIVNALNPPGSKAA